LTPFATPRARPSLVRARIRSRSNSARPPSQHQAAVRCRGVSPCVAERSESSFLLGDRRQDVEKVARRSRQAVEPRHHEHVAGVELVEDAAKLDAIGLRAAGHLALHFLCAGGLNPGHLASTLWPSVDIHLLGMNHGMILLLYSAPEKPFLINGFLR
jgi:hypothetical protein